MPAFERVASVTEVPPNGRKSIIIDDVPALLVRVGNDFFAIEDVCSHDGQPLTDGPVAEGAITCPRHGAKFDLKTGNALCMPATRAISTFAVQVRDGDVFVGPAGTELPSVSLAASTTAPPVVATAHIPIVSAAASGDQVPTPEP